MTRTRVALVINELATGGVERQVLTLAKELDRERFEVELIPLKGGGPLTDHVSALGLATWSPESKVGFDLAAVRRMARHFKERRFDVVLAANQYASAYARGACALGARPGRLISAFHSSPAHIRPGHRDRVAMILYRLALRGFDRIVYVSAQQRDEWRALGLAPRLQSSIIYNGIDVARFLAAPSRDVRTELGWTREDFVVGLCAALRPEKRPVDLVQAVAELRRHGAPAKLLFIGDGPQRAAVEAAVANAGLAGHVHLAGLQSDVAPFIHACDVMSLVSSAEAFSIAVLEAMACGKAMVLTQVGGAAEQITEGLHGHLVPVGEPAVVAERLLGIWRDGSAMRMGQQARERVQREFSLRHMIDQYEQLFAGEPERTTLPAQLSGRPV